MGAHVERQEQNRGISSHQFGADLQAALQADGIIGCCPLVAPTSFPFASWNGVTADWGHLLWPQCPVFDLLCSTPDEQRRLTHHLARTGRQQGVVCTHQACNPVSAEAKKTLERSGRIVHVFRKGSRVAACKGSFRTARLRAVKSKEGWSRWASTAALRLQSTNGALKSALEAICLTEEGVVPLQLTDCEALMGPAGSAYSLCGKHLEI